MNDQQQKANEFRKLHVPGTPVVLFNVWDAGSARAVAASGAAAVATSSWSVADANGFADGERTPLALAIDILRRIASAIDLPVTIDLESGYGDAAELVGETVAQAIEAGAVGCNIEDSVPANGALRATADQAVRIRRAREVADATCAGFFINARSDVFFQRPPAEHSTTMVDEALARAAAYADAGANGLFAPGLVDEALIARLASASPLPVNVMVADATPPLSALAAAGVARVSYGPRPYLLAMKALQDAAQSARVALVAQSRG
jgi:2-methylisocitrate lyase-like PEP mutase family enzyme